MACIYTSIASESARTAVKSDSSPGGDYLKYLVTAHAWSDLSSPVSLAMPLVCSW